MNSTIIGNGLVRGFGVGELRSLALDHVSLEIEAGQLTLLMGPSGSGKSTLLAVLSGLMRPEAGSVRVLGEDVWRISDEARERFRQAHFGFIFQGYNLFPALTARQQLELVLEWGSGIKGAAAKEHALRLLDRLGLADKAHLRPAQLSGGEKQRVAVARALVKQPELIFADEPTAALDWRHGEEVVTMLRSAAHDDGATVLLVTHDPRIEPFADRILLMDDGRLRERPSRGKSRQLVAGAAR